jgi:hypothetical protein
MPSMNPLDPTIRKVLIGIFSIGIALGAGIKYGFIAPSAYTQQAPASPVYSLIEYERIRPGMPLTEVRAIIGSGTEISRSESVVEVEWVYPDGTKIVGTFNDNILTQKGFVAPICQKPYKSRLSH